MSYKTWTYIKRTAVELNRFVRPPTFSSQMVMLGRRPFQAMSATTAPVASLMVVRRALFVGVRDSSESEYFTMAKEQAFVVNGDDEEGGPL